MPPLLTPSNSTNQLPAHQLLLSISGDSKISLQHTSVQQLSAIPEDHELIETYEPPEEIIDDDDDTEPHILITDPAPDGGYGWVIVIASFLCNLIVDGIAYTFGLFFQEFVEYFGTTKGKVALCGSLLNGFYLAAGPVVSALANKFGCRFVTILGSIIAFVALLLSTVAPNVEVLMLTYGVMGGIGFGCIYLPAIVSVGYYFTTKRALATGLAVCGSGVGAFLFAPFTQYLLTQMDWKNTLMILAALALHCSVFGALMRPLNVHAEAVIVDDTNTRSSSRKPLLQRIAEEKRRRLLSHSNSQILLMLQNNNESKDDQQYDELKSRLFNTEPGVHSTLYLDQLFSTQSQSQQPQPQLSPIMERKVVSSESPSPRSSDPGSPVEEKGELTFPSSTTIAQSPTHETTSRMSGSAHLREARARRQASLRAMSDSSTSAATAVAAPSSQQPLQVILTSGTPTHTTANTKNQAIPVRPIYKRDIFYSGSTLTLPPNSSLQQIAESQGVVGANIGQSVVSIPARDIINKVQQQLAQMDDDGDKDANDDTYEPNICDKILTFLKLKNKDTEVVDSEFAANKNGCLHIKIPPSMKSILKEMLDFSLVKESMAFTLLSVSNIFGMMGFYVPYVYITQFAVSHVYDGDELVKADSAALLISVIGISNTVGRLCFGIMSDIINRNGTIGGIRITALTINNICLVFCGLSVIIMPYCVTYTTVLVSSVLFGFFVSAYICLTSIILVDLLGIDRLTNAFGLLSLFRGIASMLGPPLAGMIFDSTDSYPITFCVAGILLIISSMISFLVPMKSGDQLDEKDEPDGECNI
ncbi:monocarboxylate transporter 7-like isoform X2 [Oppia nitens]|uniref:monocarboxylate transporter 7-like isoform X2 n=1 Tax=Oppia nitens TaxID=1686743 RepID=UPI0023DA0F4C|nr:monocarboxylate transporter 7-like isoform X2 [Oppia nitens]